MRKIYFKCNYYLQISDFGLYTLHILIIIYYVVIIARYGRPYLSFFLFLSFSFPISFPLLFPDHPCSSPFSRKSPSSSSILYLFLFQILPLESLKLGENTSKASTLLFQCFKLIFFLISTLYQVLLDYLFRLENPNFELGVFWLS